MIYYKSQKIAPTLVLECFHDRVNFQDQITSEQMRGYLANYVDDFTLKIEFLFTTIIVKL